MAQGIGVNSLHFDDIANRVPLPDDNPYSVIYNPELRADRSGHSSLEALNRAASIPAHPVPVSPTALETALPDTELADSGDDRIERLSETCSIRTGSPNSGSTPSYAEKIDQLAEVLPHIQNIRHRSRQKNAQIDGYEFNSGSVISSWHATFRSAPDGFFTNTGKPLSQALLERPRSNVDCRLIVANDLSSDLIEVLGSAFDISPEVFEEHLLGSGWRNGSQVDRGADTWITRDISKDYTSIRWYRPVRRQLFKPATYQDRLALLDPRTRNTGFKWDENVVDEFSKPHNVRHSSWPLSNILRPHWNIHADITNSKEVQKTVAWEEHATVWSQKRTAYEIVLVLLDPLPTVTDEASGAKEALRSLGLWEPPEESTPSIETSNVGEGNLSSPAARRTSRNAFIRKRVQVRPRLEAHQDFLLVPSYLFGLFGGGTRRSRRNNEQQNSGDPENAQRDLNPVMGQDQITFQRSPSPPTTASARTRRTASSGHDEAVHTAEAVGEHIFTLVPRERFIFRGILPRGPPVDYTAIMTSKNVPNLKKYLETETSTSSDLKSWIRHQCHSQGFSPAHSGPLDFLFAIAQRDTLNVLQMMDMALTQIGRDILDDSLIQQRLMNWRLLLERFDAELRALEKSLRKFARFIAPLASARRDNHEDSLASAPFVKDLLQEGVLEITQLRRRTASSYQSLMANMSIVESKRGIAEAEGVSKLTELAFFFIPLTFSASIFSMQVKELNAADISVSAFIILAIIVTFLSNGLRLFIRSESFTRSRRGWIQNMREDAHLSPGAPIPTKIFLLWLWRRLGFLTIIVTLIVALVVSPIAVLWTRNINRGFKAVLTVLLLLLTLFGSYVMITALLYVDKRGLHFQRRIFQHSIQVEHREHTKFSASSFSWVSSPWVLKVTAASAIAIGPLVALWTQALTPGIKVGATIAIGLIYVGFIVYLLFRAIQKDHFNRQHESDEQEDGDMPPTPLSPPSPLPPGPDL